MYSKLGRSKITGEVRCIPIYIPKMVFGQLASLCSCYGATITNQYHRKASDCIIVYMGSMIVAEKVFSEARFNGHYFLCKRKFKKTEGSIRQYAGCARIIVTESTPVKITFNTKKEKALLTFYVQCYDANDAAVDASVQNLVNTTG